MHPSKSSLGSLSFLAAVLLAPLSHCAPEETAAVQAISPELAVRYGIQRSFYKKYVDAGGIPVLSSAKVRDAALLEVRHLILKLLAGRDDVRAALARKNVRVGIMAHDEFTTTMPETRNMSRWWDKRARGLGGNPVTCGEENILNFRGDPYQGENIFIHEFAHSIDHSGLAMVDDSFKTTLNKLFETEKRKGRLSGYCMQNAGEFWAEGVQSWFDCNQRNIILRQPDGKEIHILTREQLETHLPDFAALLRSAFKNNKWRYTTTPAREGEAHLANLDRAELPAFKWPPEVIAAFEEEEARRKESRKDKR